MARPGELGGRSPSSALGFLKIFMHCRHFRNLLVMLLESFVEYWANQKGVVRKILLAFLSVGTLTIFVLPAFLPWRHLWYRHVFVEWPKMRDFEVEIFQEKGLGVLRKGLDSRADRSVSTDSLMDLADNKNIEFECNRRFYQ